MVEAMSRYWWLVVLRGAIAVIFGLLALVWPAITLTALVLLFGAYALVDGAMSLAAAVFGGRAASGRRPALILEGVAGLLAGVATFAWPSITALVLLWLIAAWAVLTGVFEILIAVRLRREIRGEWLLALGGVLSILFGIVLVVWPASGALALVVLIGAYAVVFGAAFVGLGLRLRTVHQAMTAGSAQRPVTA
jgi:uncharacterized membrane protein HdeD (DUF308 family)